jgi:hypothetical protein
MRKTVLCSAAAVARADSITVEAGGAVWAARNIATARPRGTVRIIIAIVLLLALDCQAGYYPK